MCAIFGWFKPGFARGVDRERLFSHLARKSQAHGQKSFGVAGRRVLPAGAGVLAAAVASAVEVSRYTGMASTWLQQNAKDVKKYAALDVLIGHTRMPTHGAVTKLNAHPFPIGDWLVAHNGMIRNSADLMSRSVYVAKGETDSEEALCFVVSEGFTLEALKEIEGCWAFEAISRDGQQGLLMVDDQQSLYVAKMGTGFVWCTDGDALGSSLKAAGCKVDDDTVTRIRSQILNLATGEVTPIPPVRVYAPQTSMYEGNWRRESLLQTSSASPALPTPIDDILAPGSSAVSGQQLELRVPAADNDAYERHMMRLEKLEEQMDPADFAEHLERLAAVEIPEIPVVERTEPIWPVGEDDDAPIVSELNTDFPPELMQ